nr:immunoglobulin light chain junction region [Macaca mulatta]
RQQYNDWNSF